MASSLDRLDNCIDILNSTTIVGNDTLDALNYQTDKIKLIKQKNNNMNPQINRSRYIINSMFRHNKRNEVRISKQGLFLHNGSYPHCAYSHKKGHLKAALNL